MRVVYCAYFILVINIYLRRRLKIMLLFWKVTALFIRYEVKGTKSRVTLIWWGVMFSLDLVEFTSYRIKTAVTFPKKTTLFLRVTYQIWMLLETMIIQSCCGKKSSSGTFPAWNNFLKGVSNSHVIFQRFFPGDDNWTKIARVFYFSPRVESSRMSGQRVSCAKMLVTNFARKFHPVFSIVMSP